MKQYLLDTNICIYLLKGLFAISEKIEAIGQDKFFLSEITIAELKFGAANSDFPDKNAEKIALLQQMFKVIPIFNSLDIYAREKSRLKKTGRILDDFDLLIGATAISNDLILITRNVSDFERLDGIEIENWTIKL
nr:type II toxin-antitoxin system VapC family toxin [uncultured Mucilaginibacter sp.]